MAMYDWNGNKNDMVDNFIDYQIYKDCPPNNGTSRSTSTSSSPASGFWIVFIISAIVSAFSEGFGVLILLVYGFLKIMGM